MSDEFLKPEEFNIDNLFNGKYNVPIYQRPYSWGTTQVEQLMRDMFSAYNNRFTNNNSENLLFVGTIFIKNERNVLNKYTEYTIVDGQQRITTLTLVLMVILNYLNSVKSEDDAMRELKDYLWKKTSRQRDKQCRALTLGNIDKDIMARLFDELFSDKDIIAFADSQIEKPINEIEKNLLNNLLKINSMFIAEGFQEEDFYDFFEYIQYNIRIIAIKLNTDLVKVFSIFESINSKGKPLDEIDKIKTYIFQNIHEEDYDEYLKKWGDLIIATGDNLMDYLSVFIKANINYYKYGLKLKNLKNLCSVSLRPYYKTNSDSETLKALIDDMLINVESYCILSDINMLTRSTLSYKAKCFIYMNALTEYNSTNPLFFKLLLLRKNNNISNEVFDRVIGSAYSFIMTYQSICAKESKKTSPAFEAIQDRIYKLISSYDDVSDLSDEKFSFVEQIFSKMLIDNAITEDLIRRNIKANLTYTQNKKVVKNILSYLEYMDDDNNVDFTKLFALLSLGKFIHIDHILPQNPSESDDDYKYYIRDEYVILKEGQDFYPKDSRQIVNKDDFYDDFLNVLGNLRIAWLTDNIRKSNRLVEIRDYGRDFNNNDHISKRLTLLINQIMSSDIIYAVNINQYNSFARESDNNYDLVQSKYNKGFDYQNYRPIFFELLEGRYIVTNENYTKLLLKVMETLYDLDRVTFERLADNKYKPMNSSRVYISTDVTDVRDEIVLDDKIFVESNLQSEYIIKFIYLVLGQLGLEESDLKIYFRKK